MMAHFYVIFSHFNINFIKGINSLIFTLNRLEDTFAFLYCSFYYTDMLLHPGQFMEIKSWLENNGNQKLIEKYSSGHTWSTMV